MSQLISRILLTVFMLPLGAVVYMVTLQAMDRTFYFRSYSVRWEFLFGGVVAWGFVAAYWVLVWRKVVRWTGGRVSRTLFSTLPAALMGVVLGALFIDTGGRSFASFIGSISAPLLWLVMTVFIWRESRAERVLRMANMGTNGVVCLTCGYNMTGLKEARCPECGSEFTLDQLVAGQPGQVMNAGLEE